MLQFFATYSQGIVLIVRHAKSFLHDDKGLLLLQCLGRALANVGCGVVVSGARQRGRVAGPLVEGTDSIAIDRRTRPRIVAPRWTFGKCH